MSETRVGYGGTPRARLTSQGQITLPKSIREALGARPGDDVLFERRGEEIVLRHRPRKSILDFAAVAADTAPAWDWTPQELDAVVGAAVAGIVRDEMRQIETDIADHSQAAGPDTST